MPSAFNDDVQFGLQVSRPTNLYALKALQLREKVFQWIARRAMLAHRIPFLYGFEVSICINGPNGYQWHRIRTRSLFLILFCFHLFVTKQGESISETAIRGNSRRS